MTDEAADETVAVTVVFDVVTVAVAAALAVVVGSDGNVKLLVLFGCCVVAADVTTVVACTRSISGLVMASNKNDNTNSRKRERNSNEWKWMCKHKLTEICIEHITQSKTRKKKNSRRKNCFFPADLFSFIYCNPVNT